MEPSDGVKKSTEERAVKPFTGNGARTLNRLGRRRFIGNVALLAVAGPSVGESLAGAPEQATVDQAVLYVRRLNTAEVRFNTINGRFTESLLL
jgi:hypothetical protein